MGANLHAHDIGVIHGRFQLLHNDHLKYLLTGRVRCRHLIVGITNPDPEQTRDDPADPARSRPSANPFTYYERHTMVRDALAAAGLPFEEFTIVPFPINRPELYAHYVPEDAVYFLSIYDDWGRRKQARFAALGLATEVISERPLAEKGISATDVRRRIVAGEAWEQLVPPSTAKLIIAWDAASRLRTLAEKESRDR